MAEKLKIKTMYGDVKIPKQATSGSAGLDICIRLDEYNDEANDVICNKLIIPPKGRVKVGTGLKFQLPKNHVMLIFPRSSTGIKKGLRLQNSTGVLDEDYRGECMCFLENTTDFSIEIEQNERLLQAIIIPYPRIESEVVEELEETVRGEGGFGSTGRF